MKIRITELQRSLLLKYDETRSLAEPLLLREGDLVLEGGESELDDLREACADLLARIGFDSDYSVNNEGAALEDLVDRLFLR